MKSSTNDSFDSVPMPFAIDSNRKLLQVPGTALSAGGLFVAEE
jgi:hypothetical protein